MGWTINKLHQKYSVEILDLWAVSSGGSTWKEVSTHETCSEAIDAAAAQVTTKFKVWRYYDLNGVRLEDRMLVCEYNHGGIR